MTKVALSVVIPSYNHERYIGAALDSVRDQTLPPGEVRVVDDGSTDDSVRVVRDHDVPGLTLVEQENRGAHAAINRAISETTGDYVAILNSDDLYEVDHLEQMLAEAQATRAGLVFGSVTLIDPVGDPLPSDHEVAEWYRDARADAMARASVRDAVRPHNVAMTTSNFLLHRSLWEGLGGFREYRYVHDYDFLLRAIELCPDRVRFASGLRGVRYRIHPSNTIAENIERALGEREEMLASLGGVARKARVLVSGRGIARDVRRGLDRPVAGLSGPASDHGPGLRVGLVTPSLDVGGLEEVVSTLACGLAGLGCSVSITCETDGLVAGRLRAAGLPVRLVRSGSDYREWVHDSEPDVVSTHFAGLDAVRAIGETGVPIVETVHNTYGWFQDADWAVERAKWEHVTDGVAVSATAARYFERYVDFDSALAVVPNAVDPVRAAARSRTGESDGGARFVFLGRLTEQKNVHGLVEAFADVPAKMDARLLLVGPADRGVGRDLVRRHPALFSEERVRMLPPVPVPGPIFSAADAYVANSFYEGWSVAASEALWAGAGLVLSECGGARELVGEEGERGILVPNPLGDPLLVSHDALASPPAESVAVNRAALTEAFVEIAADLDAWRAGALARRAFARETLAPSRMARDYLEVLTRAAGKRHG